MGINTTGASLHKRGYRVYSHTASLKPTIASAMLQIGDWKPTRSLIDPMCGGATIPIEAALEASDILPNHLRKDFAFLKLKICNQEDFERMRAETLAQRKEKGSHAIYAMEKFSKHMQGEIENAKKAGVYEAIKFEIERRNNPSRISRSKIRLNSCQPAIWVEGKPKKRRKNYTKAS